MLYCCRRTAFLLLMLVPYDRLLFIASLFMLWCFYPFLLRGVSCHVLGQFRWTMAGQTVFPANVDTNSFENQWCHIRRRSPVGHKEGGMSTYVENVPFPCSCWQKNTIKQLATSKNNKQQATSNKQQEHNNNNNLKKHAGYSHAVKKKKLQFKRSNNIELLSSYSIFKHSWWWWWQ